MKLLLTLLALACCSQAVLGWTDGRGTVVEARFMLCYSHLNPAMCQRAFPNDCALHVLFFCRHAPTLFVTTQQHSMGEFHFPEMSLQPQVPTCTRLRRSDMVI